MLDGGTYFYDSDSQEKDFDLQLGVRVWVLTSKSSPSHNVKSRCMAVNRDFYT